MFMGMALVQQTLAFRFQDVLGLTAVETAQTFGMAMGCSAAASLLSQIGLMQRINLTPFQWLRIALPVLALAFAGLALADTPVPHDDGDGSARRGYGTCRPRIHGRCILGSGAA